MEKLLQTLSIPQSALDFEKIPLSSMRKLVFEDSFITAPHIPEKLPSSLSTHSKNDLPLSRKLIQKPKLQKFSSPSKLFGRKSPLVSKCATPNPEIKPQLENLSLKARSYSSMESVPTTLFEIDDCVIEEFKSKKISEFNMIRKEELAQLIQRSNEEELLVVDCRYAFEFQGGHIRNAVNINNDPFRLLELFYFGSENNNIETTSQKTMDSSTGSSVSGSVTENFLKENSIFSSPTKEIAEKLEGIALFQTRKIVFHCEFSQCRGPKMYNLLRSLDREINYKNYPHLTYPEIYLLEGGYSAFSESYPEFCEPKGQYRKMKNKSFANEFVEQQLNSRKMWDMLRNNREKIIQSMIFKGN